MSGQWTSRERKWIDKLRAILKSKPNNVKLYTIDSEITVAKFGVESELLSETIENNIIASSDVMTFAHDHLCNKGMVKLK